MNNLSHFSTRINEDDKDALKVIAAQKKLKVQEIVTKLIADYVRDNKNGGQVK